MSVHIYYIWSSACMSCIHVYISSCWFQSIYIGKKSNTHKFDRFPNLRGKKNKSQKTSTPLTYTYLNYLYVSGFIQGTKYIKHVENVCKFLLSSWNLQKKNPSPDWVQWSFYLSGPWSSLKANKNIHVQSPEIERIYFPKMMGFGNCISFWKYSFFLNLFIYLDFQ